MYLLTKLILLTIFNNLFRWKNLGGYDNCYRVISMNETFRTIEKIRRRALRPRWFAFDTSSNNHA